jgi:hypothetical protein
MTELTAAALAVQCILSNYRGAQVILPHIRRINAARNSGPTLFGGDHCWPGQLVEGLVGSHVPRPIRSAARIERLVRYLGRADDESDVPVDEGANVGRQLGYHSVTGLVAVGQGSCILCLCHHPAIMLRTSLRAQMSARRRRRLRDRPMPSSSGTGPRASVDCGSDIGAA